MKSIVLRKDTVEFMYMNILWYEITWSVAMIISSVILIQASIPFLGSVIYVNPLKERCLELSWA